MSEEKQFNESLTLLAKDIRYFRHFIRSYYKNFDDGKLDNATHDAFAVLNHLSALIGECPSGSEELP